MVLNFFVQARNGFFFLLLSSDLAALYSCVFDACINTGPVFKDTGGTNSQSADPLGYQFLNAQVFFFVELKTSFFVLR